MRRVFLDANILSLAAYREGAGPLALWNRPDVQLLSSGYAAEQASQPGHVGSAITARRAARRRPNRGGVPLTPLPRGVRLPENDEPILRTAMATGATHLLTGDLRDFGHLLGRLVGGLRVQTPGEFLRQ